MSLTANELIMIATPGLFTLMACLTVYFSNRALMRRRAERNAAASISADPAGNVWLQLTADESATIRKLLEKDLLEKTGDERPSVVSAGLSASRR